MMERVTFPTLLAVLVAVACGCNTCLDTSGVPLQSGDLGPLDDAADDASPHDATLRDMGQGDVGPELDGGPEPDGGADADACVPESDEEFCTRLARTCSNVEARDNCGTEREVNCGECDERSAECDRDRDVCSCLDGFEPGDDPRACDDINECEEGLDDCARGTNCTNLPGTFQCSTCPSGYLDVNGDGTECVDLDECENGTAACDPVVQCTNLDGSYECGSCPAGYDDVNGDGTDCDDIDECADGTDNCDANATCTNTPGAFDCTCNTGFTGNGTSCSDVDECANGTDNCDANATCANNDGSFDCTCNTGYQGDGVTCDMLALVTQVETYEVTIGQAQTTETVSLNEAWDVAQTVPFTSLSTEFGDRDDLSVDVFLDADDKLKIQRGEAGSELTLVVTLVEFDDQAATVQSGEYTLNGTNTSRSILSTSDAKAFVYHSVQTSQSEGDFDRIQVRVELAGDQVLFHRGDGSGEASGHYWVVTSELGHFSSQQVRVDVSGFNGCSKETINQVDRAHTFLLWSNEFDGGAGSSFESHVGCGFDADDRIECCHGGMTGSLPVTVHVVEFSADSGGAVEGQLDSFGGLNFTVQLSQPVGASSMPLLGTSGNFGALPAGGFIATETPAGYVRLQFTGNDQLDIIREDSTGMAYPRWQVVHWPD